MLCGLCHCDVAIALQGHVNVIRGHLEADNGGQTCTDVTFLLLWII